MIKRIEGKVPFLVVPIPKLAFYFDWVYALHKYDKNNNPRINIYWETEDNRIYGIITDFIDLNQFEILGKYSELTEELCEKLIEKVYTDFSLYAFKDYIDFRKVSTDNRVKSKILGYISAKESLKSLLKVNNLYLKDWLDLVSSIEETKASEEFLIILINK